MSSLDARSRFPHSGTPIADVEDEWQQKAKKVKTAKIPLEELKQMVRDFAQELTDRNAEMIDGIESTQ